MVFIMADTKFTAIWSYPLKAFTELLVLLPSVKLNVWQPEFLIPEELCIPIYLLYLWIQIEVFLIFAWQISVG